MSVKWRAREKFWAPRGRPALKWLKARAPRCRDDDGMDTASPAVTDLRGLMPPEPMLRILERIAQPGDGPYRFVLPHEPRPLYPMLQAEGWTHQARPVDNGIELTVIRRPA